MAGLYKSVWVCILCMLSLVCRLQFANAIEAGGLRAILRSRTSKSGRTLTATESTAAVKIDQAAVCYSLKEVFRHEGMSCGVDVFQTYRTQLRCSAIDI